MQAYLHYVQYVFALLALCGTGYYVLCLWSARAFRRDKPKQSVPAGWKFPAVSILKPLKGADREIYASFRSHCLQDYPGEYELIFGVNEATDEAVPLVRQLMAEFPERPMRLVICPEVLGSNRKISNLVQMATVAKHQHLLVNDSDIKVSPQYLRRVMSEFADEKVGMVTCLYRGAAEQTFGSRVESVGISTDFAAGVLAARKIEGGVHFALGSTLAMRRDALEQIGGFTSVVDYLADDYELGKLISEAGWKVELSPEVVDTFLHAYTFREMWEHQMRWARSTRDSRKMGYVGVGLTFGLPWALLAVLASHEQVWAWALAGVVLAVRLALAVSVGYEVVGDKTVLPRLALVPVRDVIALAVWIWSFAGNTVVWRGERFYLREGKLYHADGPNAELEYFDALSRQEQS